MPFNHADHFGNASNTWVSAESEYAEHWVRLDWDEPITINEVDLWWSKPEWRSKAFRVEYLSDQNWVALTEGGHWYRPTERQSVLTFAPREVRSIRIVQPAAGGGERALLAMQEFAAQLSSDAAPAVIGAVTLSAAEFAALTPTSLPRNIAHLSESQPGASTDTSDGSTLGVEWPIQHVIEGAAVVFAPGSPLPGDGDVALEIHNGASWIAVNAEQHLGDDRLEFTFRPTATRACRARITKSSLRPTDLEVLRYIPSAPNVWPDHLVTDNAIEREVLSSDGEPSFESISTLALSMSPAKTLLGLKDAAHETGATWDGRLISRDTLSFAIGDEEAALADVRDTVTRTLIDGWRPGVIVSGQIGDIRVTETAFVIHADPDRTKPTLFVRVELENLTDAPIETSLTARVAGGSAPADAVVLATTSEVSADTIRVPMAIPAGESVAVEFKKPHDAPTPAADADLYMAARFDDALDDFRAYWDELLEPGMVIDLPEPRVENLYRAVLTQLFIGGDGDIMYYGSEPGAYYRGLYGVEEGFAMMALAFSGFYGDAQRYMDGTYLTPEFLVKVPEYKVYANRHQQYRNGLQPHYAVQAYRFSRDREWLAKHLDLLRTCAEWTIEQRATTMQTTDPRPLHWGLLPKWSYGGDIAGLQCYALYPNFACWRGMADTAWALNEFGDSETSERYAKIADDYRTLLLEVVEANYQPDHEPPFLPLRLDATEPVGDDYYQLFAGLLLDLLPFDPGSKHWSLLADYMVEDNLMFCNMPRFRRDAGAGGLDGIYGLGYLLGKLHEGEIDEFLLGFYGYLAFNMDRETFASRETNLIYASDLHVRSKYKVPDMSDPVPCSSAVALHYLRNMLVTEAIPADGSLKLLAGAPRAWFRDGSRVRFADAPTHFGKMTCDVISRIDKGRIEATIIPPTRDEWQSIHLRLPHPHGMASMRATVNGRPADVSGEVIALKPGPRRFRVVARYLHLD